MHAAHLFNEIAILHYFDMYCSPSDQYRVLYHIQMVYFVIFSLMHYGFVGICNDDTESLMKMCGFWKSWGVFFCISSSIMITLISLRLIMFFISDPLPKKIRKVPHGLPTSISSVSVDVASLVSEPRLSSHVPSIWPTCTHTCTSCTAHVTYYMHTASRL